MQYYYSFFVWFLGFLFANAQQHIISGKVLDGQSKKPLSRVLVSIEGSTISGLTEDTGSFVLSTALMGNRILNLTATDYIAKRIPIFLEGDTLTFDRILLERDISFEQTDNLITLTDSELLDDEINSNSSGLLQATRDVFLNRAAFDFGQAFFRVRGYDSQNGQVLLNGIPMNKFQDGRPQWNNWGGLNDITRNQQFVHGLQPSDYTFGGILGTTHIDTRPSQLRPGTRLSSSFSNRTYTGRLMVTHTSNTSKNGMTYSISASRRWAKQGYINGTLYDAYSIFGALEYVPNENNSVHLTGLWASNRRGRSSAITEEVFHLVGKRYNPYWGEQDGEIRNSRERKIEEPILMLNHTFKSNDFSLNTAVAYQWGSNKRSRLAYFNAPNPDPTYYRYLPSFYINSPIGANFISAQTARDGFLGNPQLDWGRVYSANRTGTAAYVFYDDVIDAKKLTLNTNGSLKLNSLINADFGLTYQQLRTENYSEIDDLLGADLHHDIDPFSDTRNDINGTIDKREGDRFGYNYTMEVSKIGGFAQLRFSQKKWDAFVSGLYAKSRNQRGGIFQNERFPTNSSGKSEEVRFIHSGVKAGAALRFSGRHSLVFNGAYLNRPPVLQNIFINPRENNEIVPNLETERINTVDINYHLRLPKITARFTGFYTRFQNVTDINFFFVDAGVGSDFVQEVVTDLDKLHKGMEIGMEYQVSSTVQLTAVAAIGDYRYASNPSVTINFDTAGDEEDIISQEGAIDLGSANIKGYRLAQGPQQAYALGINYRDPKYWWIGATTNYLTHNYGNISTINRTESFYLDPETGNPFPNATEENVNKLLMQRPLESFYLLNLVGGKSWLKNNRYISIFASVNNVFDTTYRTGGYEQSRNGNFGRLQQDNLSGTPSFAPKYWYGYGRTFFLNLAYSF